MKTKLSNDMINKLEVLNTIAAKHGHTDWHTATWNLTDDDINELTFEAMDLYTELSNSHKHGVMGSAFDESKPCYCTLCERTYKNYVRFKIHMLKKHYP
jgi:hypothetical protein